MRLHFLAGIAAFAFLASACSGESAQPQAPTPASPDPEAQAATSVVATNLEVPWGLTFLPNGDAVVTERAGRLNIMSAANTNERRTIEVPGVVEQGEGGLLGVAVSPTFDSDSFVYVYMTTATDNRVVRLTLNAERTAIADRRVLVQNIAKASNHNGGRIAFGPDNMLYAGTGDASDEQLSQDRASLNGKILRMTPDGQPAPGNPNGNSLVYSLGHRNVQGLAWDESDRMYGVEFGQNTFDEVNRIEPGNNYGWPTVEGSGDTQAGRFTNPITTWSTDEASPSGAAFVAKDQSLYVAALGGERLWRVPLDGNGAAGEPEPLLQGEFGRLRTPVVAPDGSLWITTSNADNYGDASPGEDQIVRLDVSG